jgi:small-conductance mechanosensitive channel
MSRTIQRHLRLFGLAIFAFLGAAAFAQSNPSPQEQPYPVQLDGRTIFYVRSIKYITPEARATGIAGRIQRLAADPYFRPDTITVIDSEISSDIVAGDTILTVVIDAEAQAEGRNRYELAVDRAEKIKAAIQQYRRDHSTQNILKASGFALLTTIGFLILLFLTQRSYRYFKSHLKDWLDTKIVPAQLKKYDLVHSERIEAALLGLAKILRLIAILTLLYFYVGLVFSFFPSTRDVAGQLLHYTIGPLKTMWHAVRLQIPKLFFILILVLVARSILKVMRVFFGGIETGTIEIAGFYPEWAIPSYKLVRILVIVFALTIAYPYIPGSGSDAFKGVSLFVGLLISLGSSSFIGNIIAGLTMTYMRAFKIGDRVKIEDFTGDVVETSLQVTHLKTAKNEIISVPNSKIINSNVINYSALAREKGLILHTTVGVGYYAPWRQVRAMLLLAAENTPGVLKDPPPFVHQKSLDEFCVTYELNAYTDNPQLMGRTYSDLHKNILDNFNEYKVQIMTPNYEGDPHSPAIVPKDKWYASPADKFDDEDTTAVKKLLRKPR